MLIIRNQVKKHGGLAHLYIVLDSYSNSRLNKAWIQQSDNFLCFIIFEFGDFGLGRLFIIKYEFNYLRIHETFSNLKHCQMSGSSALQLPDTRYPANCYIRPDIRCRTGYPCIPSFFFFYLQGGGILTLSSALIAFNVPVSGAVVMKLYTGIVNELA